MMMMMAVARQRAPHRSGGSTLPTYTYIHISTAVRHKKEEFLQPDGSSLSFSLESCARYIVYTGGVPLCRDTAAAALVRSKRLFLSHMYMHLIYSMLKTIEKEALYTSPRDRNDIVWYLRFARSTYFSSCFCSDNSISALSAPSSSGVFSLIYPVTLWIVVSQLLFFCCSGTRFYI